MGSLAHDNPVPADIAVIGLACRFPGGASNTQNFWDLLYQQKATYADFPRSRDNASTFYQEGDKINATGSQKGHFLQQDVSAFDAPFFGITGQEAKAMHPTARLLLEVTYEAFENAGLAIEQLAGSNTSCYVGCSEPDLAGTILYDPESPTTYKTTTSLSLLSSRISWYYDFRGPSLTLDTGSSSGLVALHLACQALGAGESKLAVVSGANLILNIEYATVFANPDRFCQETSSKSFAGGAVCHGRGEGVASILLKPLNDALRDGDPIRAIIRGTGVNQDGHTIGATVPNSNSPAELIRSTYDSAGLDFSHTVYLEAHGTARRMGDAFERTAVARSLGYSRKEGRNLLVGSVTSNIGNLEGASGLASIVKSILMLERGIILPNVHTENTVNPRCSVDLKLATPTSCIRWPLNSPRRVSVHNLGSGGTNAHAILDDATEYLTIRGLQDSSSLSPWVSKNATQPRLFVFSAHDEAALRRMKKQYADYLESYMTTAGSKFQVKESAFLDQLAFTLSERRSRFDWKTHVVASSIKELRTQLSSSTVRLGRSSTSNPQVAFVFTGQSENWARMGVGLFRYPAFKKSILDADEHLKEAFDCDYSFIEELKRDDKGIETHLAAISHPMSTVLQVALVDLLRSWNIIPAGVVGHSSGEIGAAYAYGVISREDAWTIAYWRSKLCSELTAESTPPKEAMLAVALSKDAVQEHLSTISHGQLVIACVNSPSSVTISGKETAIGQLHEKLSASSVFCRQLKVPNAFNSHHMEQISQRYLEKISTIRPKSPMSARNIVMVSSVAGEVIEPRALAPEYWVRNLVSPVKFSDAIEKLFKNKNFDFLLEVGPDSTLKGPLRQIMRDLNIQNVTYKSIISSGEDAISSAANSAGMLYTQGFPLCVTAINMIDTRLKPMTDLPPYPWNHSLKYCIESQMSSSCPAGGCRRHDILGSVALGSNELEPKWRNLLRVSEQPWIQDHVVRGETIYPAGGIVAMAIESVKQIANKVESIEKIHLKNVHIPKVIVIPDNEAGIECSLQLRRPSSTGSPWTNWWEFSVLSSLDHQKPEQIAFGLVKVQYKSDDIPSWEIQKTQTVKMLRGDYQKAKLLCTRRINPKDFYEAEKQAGLNYGPCFQGLTDVSTHSRRCCFKISAPITRGSMPGRVESPYTIHPVSIEIMFHSLLAALGGNIDSNFHTVAIPVSFDSMTVAMELPVGENSKFHGHCEAIKEDSGEVVGDVFVSDRSWVEPKVLIRGVHFRKLPPATTPSRPICPWKAPFGTLAWKPDIHLCQNQSLEDYLSQTELVLDLVAHKNPDMSILQLGGSLSMTRSILSVLATDPEDTSRFSNLVAADTNSAIAQDFEDKFRDWGSKLSFIKLNEDLDLQGQTLSPGSFDLIITGATFSNNMQKTRFLQDVQGLLKNGGVFLILESFTDITKTKGWESVVIQSGLQPIGMLQSDDDEVKSVTTALCVTVKAYTEVQKKLSDVIYIVQPPNLTEKMSEIGQSVIRRFSSSSMPAQIVEWPPDPAKLKEQPVISLLELTRPFLINISSRDFEMMKTIVQGSSSFLWVSMGSEPMMTVGMGFFRVLRNENPKLNVRFLLFEEMAGRQPDELAGNIFKVMTSSNPDGEFIQMDGQLCINRWSPDKGISRITTDQGGVVLEAMALEESQTPLRIHAEGSGQEQSWYFVAENELSGHPAPGEVDIVTRAVVLSNQDSTASSPEPIKEFSGIVKSVHKDCPRFKPGDRVYGCQPAPYRTVYRVKERFCQQILGDDPFEKAASRPITFGTAYYSLVKIANLQYGQTVLIQAASTAVGQAGVQIAQAQVAVVFATVRTEEESLLVEKLGIPRERILNDADPELCTTISRLSGRKGFDVILNISKDGEDLGDLWRSVASFGHLISAAAANQLKGPDLDMAPFQKGCSFAVVDMNLIYRENPTLMAEISKDLGRYLATSSLRPIEPTRVYSSEQISDAFKSTKSQDMSPGTTIVSFNPQDELRIHPTARNPLHLQKEASYVLVGGLGGFGRHLARLLVDHGARHMVFLSRSALMAANAQAVVDEIAARGVITKVFVCDISDETTLSKVVEQCRNEMPPIRGVIQSTAVDNDSLDRKTTHELWLDATRIKIRGSWLLHKLLPRKMDFFVLVGSTKRMFGNRTQASHAAVNTFQHALAQYRRHQGLAGAAVDLGPMLGEKFVAEKDGSTNILNLEAPSLSEAELQAIMVAAMTGSYGSNPTPVPLVTGLPTGGLLHRQGLDGPSYYSDPRFSFLKKMDFGQNVREEISGEENEESSLAKRLRACQSLEEASKEICSAMCEFLGEELQTGAENLEINSSLYSNGADSLLAVEMRSWLLRQMGAEISLGDMLSGHSISELADKIATASTLIPAGVK
ncbi:uncharacterized protein Z518_06497 [Rhinocladiella mackenziei CBS 650.93]|uniref:Polyketide synthase n=1 Tax=Rhinocladiella mackenziei CBS 650.93 TaxID=1442369 RepID=A0A0D2FLT8_9EURO|nr:uncharacterized protein Z518_06497 [Rhinocladiella mackenziei CBS 650.93]KIX02947.1 hypothetical protein Z518_06497 [Rhinocladiella mackenziei CBS 650.93]